MSAPPPANLLNSVASLVTTYYPFHKSLSCVSISDTICTLIPFCTLVVFSHFYNLLFYFLTRYWYFLGLILSHSLSSIPCLPMATCSMPAASSATWIVMTASQYLHSKLLSLALYTFVLWLPAVNN